MLFPYQCQKCEKRFDGDFPIGQAPRQTPCPSCGGEGKRVYEGLSIGVRVGGQTTCRTFGEERKLHNMQTAYRMKGNRPPVRPVAYDYGNGDIREVAKKAT